MKQDLKNKHTQQSHKLPSRHRSQNFVKLSHKRKLIMREPPVGAKRAKHRAKRSVECGAPVGGTP
jgi:hypothetical protein